MIGWTRRDEEDRRRRAAWFATLTPEEKKDENEYQDPLFFFGWMAAAFVADEAQVRPYFQKTRCCNVFGCKTAASYAIET